MTDFYIYSAMCGRRTTPNLNPTNTSNTSSLSPARPQSHMPSLRQPSPSVNTTQSIRSPPHRIQPSNQPHSTTPPPRSRVAQAHTHARIQLTSLNINLNPRPLHTTTPRSRRQPCPVPTARVSLEQVSGNLASHRPVPARGLDVSLSLSQPVGRETDS